jgi:hypothetical protein
MADPAELLDYQLVRTPIANIELKNRRKRLLP